MSGSSHDHSAPALAVFFLLIFGAVIGAVMTYAPIYFADRDIGHCLHRAVTAGQPLDDDAHLLGLLNEEIRSKQLTRYWVEDGIQRHALDLQIAPDELKVTRNGNVGLAMEVRYTQTVVIPIWGRVMPVEFVDRDEASK